MKNKILEELVVVKRTGQRVSFNGTKIALAIKNAFDSLEDSYSDKDINKIYEDVLDYINSIYIGRKTINVEDIQDIIEKKLVSNNYEMVYEAFNSYRLRRAASRKVFSIKQQHKFVKAIENLGLQTNANLNEQPQNIILDFGKTISKEFTKAYLLENKYVRAHEERNIYIHDLYSYPLYTTTSTHLDFSLIDDNYIDRYLNRIVSIIKSCKQEQTGEHSITNLDQLLSKIVLNNFKQIYKKNLFNYLKLNGFINYVNTKQIDFIIDKLKQINFDSKTFDIYILNTNMRLIFDCAYEDSIAEIKELLFASLKNMLLNLNIINSSINNNKIVISIGMNNNYISSLIVNIYLEILSDIKRLDNVTTIYKIDDIKDINNNVLKSIHSNKNISFSFDKDIEYFSNGEKIYVNVNSEIKTSIGRGILSTTSINLARLGLSNKGKTLNEFYNSLSEALDFIKNQLILRFELQSNRTQKNFPNLFKYKLLLDSDKLDQEQKIRKVLKNGVFNIGIIGIKECSQLLNIEEHEKIMIDILKYINNKLIQYTIDSKLNFILTQTENTKLLNEMMILDKTIYGSREFEKDKECYSKINYINIEDVDNKYKKYQDLLNMRINVLLRKNSSNIKIIDSIRKIRESGISYFEIKVGKYDN